MKLYFYIISLLLACAVVCIHARTLRFGFNDQLDDDDYNVNTRERQMLQVNPYFRRYSSFGTKSFSPFENDENILHERGILAARRAQAIVKGDPREFMG